MLRLYSYILRLYSYILLIIVTDQSARSNFHDFLLFGFFYVFLSNAVYTKLVKPEFGTINLYIQYLYLSCYERSILAKKTFLRHFEKNDKKR